MNQSYKRLPYFLFFAPFLTLLFIKNNAYYWDGIEYAWQIENKPIIYTFHKHHLFYNPFCQIFYILLNKVGFNIKAVDIMTSINIICGFLFLLFAYLLLRRIFFEFLLAPIISVLIISISYTFGAFSRQPNQYMIPVTILAFLLLSIFRKYRKDNIFKVGYIEWLLLLLATLFHQISILILPALFYAQYKSKSRNPLLTAFKNTIGIFISLTFIYLLVYYISEPSPSFLKFPHWLMGYARDKYWIFTQVQGLGAIIQKSLNDVIISHKALFFAPIGTDRKNLYLHEFATGPSDTFLAILLSWILIIIIFILFFKGFKNIHSNPQYRPFSQFLTLWILPPFLFFWFFTPYQHFYRLFYLVPIMIYVCDSLSMLFLRKLNFYIATFSIVCMIIINFLYGFIPEKDVSNNPYLMFANNAHKYTSRDCLFIFSTMRFNYHFAMYTRYFGKRDVAFVWEYQGDKKSLLSEDIISQIRENTKKIISSKYRIIYITEGKELYKPCYLKLLDYSVKDNSKQLLILHTDDFILVNKYQFGPLHFRELVLNNIGHYSDAIK